MQNKTTRVFPHLRSVGIPHIHVVFFLTVLIWLGGSLLLAFAVNGIAPQSSFFHDSLFPLRRSNQNAARSAIRAFTHPFPNKTPPPPRPTPITPFPAQLAQEVATLQAKDRFLYYGNTNLPEIALTFDDGPNPPYTSQMLAILQQYRVKATFFDLGRRILAYPDLAQQEYAEGHLIGNHTWAHPYLSHLSDESIVWQLNETENVTEQVTNVWPTLFRPPYGVYNAAVLARANAFGLTTVLWNDDPRDWSKPGVNVIVAHVLAQVGNGSIILLHDGGGDRSQTVAALPIIIQSLQQRGFHFVTVQQLLNHLHEKPTTVSSPLTTTLSASLLLIAWRRRSSVYYLESGQISSP